MSPVLATLIDTDALWHVAVFAFVAACGLVLAFGTAVLAFDRINDSRQVDGGSIPPGWVAALFCAAVFAVGIIVLGIWAMLQKS